MDIQIRLGDLGLAFLGIALLILIVYAILVLKNLNGIMKTIRKTLEENQHNINNVLNEAPSIAKNMNNISTNLSDDVKALQGTIDTIIGTTEVAAGSLGSNHELVKGVIGIIQALAIVKEWIGSFGRKKKLF